MRYISIDLETTGLDAEQNQILSFGAVVEDPNKKLPYHEVPKFYAIIRHRNIFGNITALNMNKELIGQIKSYEDGDEATRKGLTEKHGMFLEIEELTEKFFQFCWLNGMITDELNLLSNHVKILEPHQVPCDPIPNTLGDKITVPNLRTNMSKSYLTVAGKNFDIMDRLFIEKIPRWKQVFRFRSGALDPAILMVNWKKDTRVPGLQMCKDRAKIKGPVTHNALQDAWDVVQVLRTTY